ncbi:NADPH-dependent oxidoreductase [Neisseria chenwenguii]|uniref:NADPH-dependent oxidoreductase n=1 Tax=Neisseria chenwenguii TaxID=1853278 RepID=A0A220S2Z1_9NEIS|nr:NADPH-dependent oxidoreductase [Neisseria chenwenguii]ASK27797.1 NADPH-dependent oxidoreductase [Neisseria chenwenguii]
MNPITDLQKQHRSIRKFKPEALDAAQINALVDAARCGATSSYMQACTIISITDPALKQALSDISTQPYVRENGHLFMFVADLARNSEIAEMQGVNPVHQGSADRFLAGVYDCSIAAQNMVLAAESMGLGTVYLGSILTDAARVIELLALPERTFPVFALAVGYPDQSPEQKPRLPAAITHMENRYTPVSEHLPELTEYDRLLTEYYQTRGGNSRTAKSWHTFCAAKAF